MPVTCRRPGSTGCSTTTPWSASASASPPCAPSLGWQVGLLAAFVHVNVYLAGSAAVNAIGHHFGRRPYDNNAGNLQWLAFVTAGEGLHNNHHAKPTSAKLSHRWFEIDPGWWLIKTLTWLRLARLRVMSGAGRPPVTPRRAPPR